MTSATFRHPGPLAITVAGVDQMSGGRVELGLGAGWYEEEHAAYGIPFPSTGERFDLLEEQLAVITGLWASTGDFSYDGTHYRVVDSPGLPKPAQARLPVLIGGKGARRTPALAARYADEFNLPFVPFEDGLVQNDRVRRACEDVGRDPASLRFSSALVLCVGADEQELRRRAAAIGHDLDELRRDHLGRHRGRGGRQDRPLRGVRPVPALPADSRPPGPRPPTAGGGGGHAPARRSIA